MSLGQVELIIQKLSVDVGVDTISRDQFLMCVDESSSGAQAGNPRYATFNRWAMPKLPRLKNTCSARGIGLEATSGLIIAVKHVVLAPT